MVPKTEERKTQDHLHQKENYFIATGTPEKTELEMSAGINAKKNIKGTHPVKNILKMKLKSLTKFVILELNLMETYKVNPGSINL